MREAYNPIVRTFCQIRAGLVESLGVHRHEVRPGTPLESLLPVEARREVWARLRRRGLRLPDLELSESDGRRRHWIVVGVVVKLALALQRWSALLLVLPMLRVVFWVGRRRAVHIPLGLSTVGELAIHATNFGEHNGSGYRWTRDEIALKVRMTVAEAVGARLEEIPPETRLSDL